MRRSLYVKDDDFRLSFLYGNFTTLTRFTEFDLERVIDEKLSPLYVSIHSTNPELRAEMLRNPRGATSLRWLRELLRAGIEVHGQVVVCPGVNDGAELERTLYDVLSLYPELASLALVPVGVSDFTLEESMRAHNADEASCVVEVAERFQRFTRELFGMAKVFASDEFYLVAGVTPPGTESFESLDEAENGVGLVAAFIESFSRHTAMAKLGSGFFQSVDGAPALGYRAPRTVKSPTYFGEDVTVLTGEYAAPILRALLDDHGFFDVEVKAVKNRYFGGNIKVAGLLTGQDLQVALREVAASNVCLIPDVCLSEGRFLDGLTLEDLPRPVMTVTTTGHDLRTTLETVRANGLARA
jgi:NifB/MoaA-like Fe-S oxidoreductase